MMRTIPTLRARLATVGDHITVLGEDLDLLRRCRSGATVVPQIGAARAAVEAKLEGLKAREFTLDTDLACAQMAAMTYASGIVAAGRRGDVLLDVEAHLLALLDGEELPQGSMNDAEYAYVVAALAAREATGESRARSFEAFIGARAAMQEAP